MRNDSAKSASIPGAEDRAMPARLPIDVIVPAYNAAPYLAQALDSVFAQTCAVERVIVVDDGSTDATAAIARGFDVTVISGPNRGLAAARNVGIAASTATALAFLDADDRWYPERLERQWRLRAARPDILLFATDYAPWKDGVVGSSALAAQASFVAAPRVSLAPDGFVVDRFAMRDAVAVRNVLLPSSLLADRRLFVECGELFAPRETFPDDDTVFIGEDYEWLLRVLRHTDIAFVDAVLVDYRIGTTTLSARRGRIRYGDYVLGTRIATMPEAYVEGAADAFARERSRVLRDSAIAHLREGNIALVRARFEEARAVVSPRERLPFAIASLLLRSAIVRRIARLLGGLRRPGWLRSR
jgi:glycosyltransferase involved in cell wall biosynthesis